MAFQMSDDLLDYTQNSKTLGKKQGTDLRDGKITMPVIFSMKQASVNDKKWMTTIASKGKFTQSEFNRFCRFLNYYNGISYTNKQILINIELAKKNLSMLGNNQTINTLINIANYVLIRKN